MIDDKVRRKIEAAHAIATDPNAPDGERDAALAAIERLTAKHGPLDGPEIIAGRAEVKIEAGSFTVNVEPAEPMSWEQAEAAFQRNTRAYYGRPFVDPVEVHVSQDDIDELLERMSAEVNRQHLEDLEEAFGVDFGIRFEGKV